LLNARPAKRPRNTDTKPSITGKVSARGKGKAKAEKLPTPAASDESDFEVPAGDDFAMDSDEEELQLKRAIEAGIVQQQSNSFGCDECFGSRQGQTDRRSVLGRGAAWFQRHARGGAQSGGE
jgi:hypothetical protein